MKNNHKLNLIELALILLQKEKRNRVDGFRFNMGSYFRGNVGGMDCAIYERLQECGTSCCAAGYWAYHIKEKEPIDFRYIICRDFGFDVCSEKYYFLFGCYNPSCVKQFAYRVVALLKDDIFAEYIRHTKRQLVKLLIEERNKINELPV